MLMMKLKLLHNNFIPSSVLLDPEAGSFGISQEGLHVQKPLSSPRRPDRRLPIPKEGLQES